MAVTVYATTEQLGRFGLNARALDKIDPADVAESLEATSREIDSYLRSQYTLPLMQVGLDVAKCCAQMTAYDLIVTRGLNPELAGDDTYEKRYARSVRWLEQIAGGRAFPDITDSSAGATRGHSPAGPKVRSGESRGWSRRGTTDNGGGPFST